MFIRYRVWNEEKMIYPSETEFQGYYILPSGHLVEVVHGEKSFSRAMYAMLSTNLKDKHGKEIFDQDIMISFGSYFEVYQGDSGLWIYGRKSTAEWEREEILFEGRALYSKCQEMMVVGNKYENPELLTSAS